MADALLAAGGAEMVSDGDGLAGAVARLLDDARQQSRMGKLAAQIAAEGLGTLDAALASIAPWVDPIAPLAAPRAKAHACP